MADERKFPDWLKRMFLALGVTPEEAERRYNNVDYETVHTVQILEKLFEKNLLLLELQDAPFEEGDELLVRGVRFKVLYVKTRRLELELPPGKRFVKPRWR